MFNIHKELERWSVNGSLSGLLEIIEKYLEEEQLSSLMLHDIQERLELRSRLLKQVVTLQNLATRICEEVEVVEDISDNLPH